jgi:hypothetical protein
MIHSLILTMMALAAYICRAVSIMSNFKSFSLCFSKNDMIFKITDQNLIMIYHKSNGDFKSHIIF